MSVDACVRARFRSEPRNSAAGMKGEQGGKETPVWAANNSELPADDESGTCSWHVPWRPCAVSIAEGFGPAAAAGLTLPRGAPPLLLPPHPGRVPPGTSG